MGNTVRRLGRVTIATLLLVGAGAVPARAEPAPSQPDDGTRTDVYAFGAAAFLGANSQTLEPADRRHGRHRIRERLLAGRVGRRHLRVRRRARSSARPAASR